MRITMNMASKQYYKNLNASYDALNKATNTNTTYRKFEKASEDPVSSLKAYKLKNEYQENSNYQSNVTSLQDQFKTASSTLTAVQSVLNSIKSTDSLKGITATSGLDDRTTLANKILTLQASIVSDANVQYAGTYLFGGGDTTQPPFSVDDSNNLLYRGINVTTGEIAAGETTSVNGAQITLGDKTGKYDGYTIIVANNSDGKVTVSDPATLPSDPKTITVDLDLSTTKTNQDLYNTLKADSKFSGATITGDLNSQVSTSTISAAATKNIGQDGLKALANEKTYVDIGGGLSFNSDGSINSQSVFNSSIPGISFLGYGSSDGTETGVSKNLYNLMGQIATQLKRADFSAEKIQPYLTELNTQATNLSNAITETGTNTSYLTSTETNLTAVGDTTGDEFDSVANVDTIEAYQDYTAKYYAFQSAIKIGSNLLQSSILDYMK